MPVKIFPLHLRLLPGAMKSDLVVLRHSIPVFSRVFLHMPKHYISGPPNIKTCLSQIQVSYGGQFGVSKFSTRAGQGMKASKSLIEDESELSDWVSGLSSNSFKKTRVYSDSENDEDNNVKSEGYRSRERGGKRRGSESGFDKNVDREGRNERNYTDSLFAGGGKGRDSNKFLSSKGAKSGGRLDEKNKRDDRFFNRGDDLGSSDRWRTNEGFREKSPEMRNGRGGGRFRGPFDEKSKDSDSLFGRGRDSKARQSPRSNEDRRVQDTWNGRSGGGVRGNFATRSEGRVQGKWNGRSGGGDRENFAMRREGSGGGDRGNFGTRREGSGGADRGNFSMRREGGRGGDRGNFSMRREGNGGGDRGNFAVRTEGGRAGRRGMAIMDDKDEEEEKEEEKGHRSFKELLDSDGVDDDDEEEEEEEEEEEDGMDLAEEEEEEEDNGLFDKASDFSELQPNSPRRSDTYLSESRFDQCSISPLSLKGIKDAGFENMTLVQEATLPVILKGKDVLAKAKTGTGKTVAFLLPAIEIVLQSPSMTRDQKRPPIFVLIICPTRELASQAAAEANTLLKYHPSIGVQVVIGGTRLALEQKRMQANPCQILVATPGRLRDHVENTAGFATRLMGVKVLVLDEADHLLDMGFRKEIEKIIAAVPKQRQTLLFSATIPPEVRQICHIALKRDHEFINTVQEGSEDTHAQVRQMHLVAPLEKHFSLLYAWLKAHMADDVNYKILVFCTTAMVTRLVAELLGELSLNVREIHSRKPQSYRTRISDEFRKSKGLILVTSDVSARGVDYPDVTLVVQMGVPADRQQYIHRLGRTGRKGKEGEGVLLLAPWEEFFLSGVKDLPISKASEPLVDPDTTKKVERALAHVEMKNKEAAYQAWLGYYNSNKNVGRDKCRLVELANEFSRSMGLDNPPAISKLVLGKMGLKNIPGLRSK
ncbi:DEAD-box ATP-dependent RNA helicase 31-like [Primulina huaijiensis]|uniref:DEAD-box ATP-dependent RNA helicase 31-like n=1 Tax=Primulina huaijiensis TaxID=1492673 RepID=UPI003CC6EF3D